MNKAETPRRAPQAWLDAIAAGEADYAAGRTLDLEEVLRALEAEDAAELAAEAAAAHGPAAAE